MDLQSGGIEWRSKWACVYKACYPSGSANWYGLKVFIASKQHADIVQRRNTFVGQTNNVLCFFNKLNTIVKLVLFKSYCTIIYGAESHHHHHWLCVSTNWVRILFDRSLLIKITLNSCRLITSSTLGRRIRKGCGLSLLVNLFILKVRSELHGCGYNRHWWTIKDTILTDW